MTIKERRTPPEVYQVVCERAGGRWLNGQCFGGKCEMKGHVETHDGRGLCFAHLKHRKMGGTTSQEVHTAKSIRRSCYPCHDKHDNRTHQKQQPVDRTDSINILLGHYPKGTRPVSVADQVGKKG